MPKTIKNTTRTKKTNKSVKSSTKSKAIKSPKKSNSSAITTKAQSKSIKITRGNYKNQSMGEFDTARNLVIGGLIGIFLAYVIISRALNTGSYWEYFFGVSLIVISIKFFIRSLRLK